MDVIEEQDFVRFEFKMSFEGMSNITTPPGSLCGEASSHTAYQGRGPVMLRIDDFFVVSS